MKHSQGDAPLDGEDKAMDEPGPLESSYPDAKQKSEKQRLQKQPFNSKSEKSQSRSRTSPQLNSQLDTGESVPSGSGERRFGPNEVLSADLENETQPFSALDVLYAQGLAMAETIVDRALTDNARDDVGVRGLFSRMHGPPEGVRHGDRESLRDHLVLLHAPLVEHCARNFMASGEPLDDLVQEGYVGLIKAVDRFDPGKGVRFSTYACHLITGEIRHYLRDLGRLIHEPGWHFELRQRINRTNDQLMQQLGRPPEPEDIARHLNIEPNTVRDVLRNSQVLAVEFLDAESDRDDEDGRGGFDWDQKLANPNNTSDRSETRVEDQMMLGEALPQLRDLEKRAVTLFFFEDKTKTEIARQLGISVNHAAYLIKRGVEGLRNIIESSDVAAAAVEDLNSALWDKSALQRRTRAAYLLELTKGAANDEVPPAPEPAPVKARRGRPARRTAQVAQVVPPTAVPATRLGIITFTEFVTAVDEEVRRAARYGGEFAILWLRIQNWDEVLALHEGEEKRAITALQTLTRRCCRATDKIAMFSTGELPGLHFGILMPHTGQAGQKTGERWLETCQSSTVFPEDSKSAAEILRTDLAFAVFPENGKSADVLFTHLGQQLQQPQQEREQKPHSE